MCESVCVESVCVWRVYVRVGVGGGVEATCMGVPPAVLIVANTVCSMCVLTKQIL